MQLIGENIGVSAVAFFSPVSNPVQIAVSFICKLPVWKIQITWHWRCLVKYMHSAFDNPQFWLHFWQIHTHLPFPLTPLWTQFIN